MTMLNDPRSKNEIPNVKSPAEYLCAYMGMLNKAFEGADLKDLDQVLTTLETAMRDGKRIYVAGNGGSSSISDHLCCDWLKGTYQQGKPALKVQSLSSNTALFTALANDFGYEHSISRQIEMLGEKGDVAILISSSGNSESVLKAVSVAKEKEMTVIGFSGFKGGKLKESCDLSLYIPAHNYGVAEDSHQILMHVIAQHLAQKQVEASRG